MAKKKKSKVKLNSPDHIAKLRQLGFRQLNPVLLEDFKGKLYVEASRYKYQSKGETFFFSNTAEVELFIEKREAALTE